IFTDLSAACRQKQAPAMAADYTGTLTTTVTNVTNSGIIFVVKIIMRFHRATSAWKDAAI
ncbi:hypothetical protein MTO96_026351, partial [Rhipicephalus appendiculatus]